MLQLLAKHALARAFDDNEVRVLVEAFDQAWKAVEDSGAAIAPGAHSEATRELLALRILKSPSSANAIPIDFATMRCSDAYEPQEHWAVGFCKHIAGVPVHVGDPGVPANGCAGA